MEVASIVRSESKAPATPQGARGDVVIRVKSLPLDLKPKRTIRGQGEVPLQRGGGPPPVLVYLLG